MGLRCVLNDSLRQHQVKILGGLKVPVKEGKGRSLVHRVDSF